jgi:hypothetical protein
LGRKGKSKSWKIGKFKLAQKKIKNSNNNNINNNNNFSLWVKFMKTVHFSAAYLKILFSLLNSNQRENLILKNGYVYYNVVIILTNVD